MTLLMCFLVHCVVVFLDIKLGSVDIKVKMLLPWTCSVHPYCEPSELYWSSVHWYPGELRCQPESAASMGSGGWGTAAQPMDPSMLLKLHPLLSAHWNPPCPLQPLLCVCLRMCVCLSGMCLQLLTFHQWDLAREKLAILQKDTADGIFLGPEHWQRWASIGPIETVVCLLFPTVPN